MTDRLITRSPILALAIASLAALAGCETNNKPEDVTRSSQALTNNLVAGDVAITCFDTANPDSLQLTSLVAIDANTTIQYTDREATADGIFNTNNENVDQVVTVTSPTDAGTIPAGTTVSFVPTTGLNNGTETVFIYQGHIGTDVDGGSTDAAVLDPSARLLWGMQISPAGTWVPRNDALDLSDLPTSLGGHALALSSTGGLGAFYYDTTKGPSRGTKAVLQAAFANPAFWTSVAGPVLCATVVPGPFTVDADPVDAGADAPAGTDGGTDVLPGTDGGTIVDAGNDVPPATDAGNDVPPATDAGNDVPPATDAGNDIRTDAGNDVPPATDAGNDIRPDVAPTDAGNDIRPDVAATDAGNDVRSDTGTATDVRPDTGTTADARADVKTDAAQDTPASSGGGGCSCSTATGRDGLGASAWMLAIAGILFTARRKTKKRR